jgi:two-component system, NarL family, sensor histidine kinase UhpB
VRPSVDRYLGMPESPPPPRNNPAAPTGGAPGGSDGLWGLVLWKGSAWFSDWFYQRLQWPMAVKHTRLEDLRPNLPQGAWETLLAAIRAHLEQGTPLDVELRVQVNSERIEWWRVTGTLERNVGGQPVYLGGRMQDVTAEPRRGAPAA